ncbi:MAG: hypothetical protein COA96_17370 [SAR86 cluster bacterium]|uniref:Uncharacterized protein n=1 Tax=SAR86 cluster bacterium TaxID=2030880 RepID=A0A2A5AFC0_9GAMM|nr:MAG: hypothetical protein COA96_17370 [SAR86 cluster bacterium]
MKNVKTFGKVLVPKLSFWGKAVESFDCGMDAEINSWLASNPDITVTETKQSMTGGSWQPAKLVISIWYQ